VTPATFSSASGYGLNELVGVVSAVAVLISTYACFLFYNRFDKMTRIWLYPLLQVARSAAFTVVVSIEPAGIAA
jgi:hypothetical protein